MVNCAHKNANSVKKNPEEILKNPKENGKITVSSNLGHKK